MDDHQAIAAEVKSAFVASDGKHGIFEFAHGESTIRLALPEADLMHLMMLTSQVSGEAKKILNSDPAVKHVLPCEWWEFGPSGDKLVLSFGVPGGLEVSFQVHRTVATRMIETLQVISGQQTPQSPGARQSRCQPRGDLTET